MLHRFSPEREFIQSCLEKSQETVNGRVRLSLYCGNVTIEGRSSDTEKLYDAEQSSMDAIGDFVPEATSGCESGARARVLAHCFTTASAD